MNKNPKKLLINILALCILAFIILGLCLTTGQVPEDCSPGVYGTVLALLLTFLLAASLLLLRRQMRRREA